MSSQRWLQPEVRMEEVRRDNNKKTSVSLSFEPAFQFKLPSFSFVQMLHSPSFFLFLQVSFLLPSPLIHLNFLWGRGALGHPSPEPSPELLPFLRSRRRPEKRMKEEVSLFICPLSMRPLLTPQQQFLGLHS